MRWVIDFLRDDEMSFHGNVKGHAGAVAWETMMNRAVIVSLAEHFNVRSVD